MIDLPGDHPLPHPELDRQQPVIFTLHAGEVIFRHHLKIYDPVFFGTNGSYRFDDPDCPAPGCFGVMYAGQDPECCLLESCGATTGVPAVSGAYLDARAIARLELMEDLRFVDLVEPGGLTSIGADNRLTTGSYTVAQHWSAALRKHPSKPDGIRYRSRHAPERIAYAIYSRSPATFSVSSMGSFTDAANDALFRQVLKTYRFAYI
ncbi:MAG: RES family NAD+ phosphorylase [Edaphobacter sp.]